MKRKAILSMFIGGTFLAVFMTTASADIAPPLQPPGANPAPLEYTNTMVEMAFEEVNITIVESSELYYMEFPHDTVDAYVNAQFQMYNHGKTAETMDVIFPLTDKDGFGDGRFHNPEVQDFMVRVDSETTRWEEVTTPSPNSRGDEEAGIKWAQFTVTFPPETLVVIDVAYDVQSTGYFPEASYRYILETGSGWYGPIPYAHIYLNLPYEASWENILKGKHNMMHFEGKTSPEPVFDGKQAHWEYKNLEPSPEDNWSATIIAPHIWRRVLELRGEIESGDLNAYSKITKWYDALIMDRTIRTGTEGLIPLNLEAYEKALEAWPENDEMLAKYANFLLFLYDHDHESADSPGMLDEIYTLASEALEINILNDTALNVINWMENTHGYSPPEETHSESHPVVEPAETANEEPAIEDEITVSEDTYSEQDNTIIIILASALTTATAVIAILANKLKKQKSGG